MTILHSVLYGVVQGLTEFLPISSTAHLRLLPEILGQKDPGSAYTAVIQLGTLLAVLIFFRKELLQGIQGLFAKDRNSPDAKLGMAVLYATIPIVVLGFACKDLIKGPARSLYVIGAALIVMGIVMVLADKVGKKSREVKDIEAKDGWFVGLWQALSLIPGMSRSGSSISGGLFAGFDREAATRLSFLMSVPAITLAGLYEAYHERKNLIGDMLAPTIVGTIVSFVVGYLCIKWLIGFISKHGVVPFVAYRVVLGILIIGLCAGGVIKPISEEETANVPSQTTASH